MTGEWDLHLGGDGHDGTTDDDLHDLGGGYDFADHFAGHDFAGHDFGAHDAADQDVAGYDLSTEHGFTGHDLDHDFGRDYVSADDLGTGHDYAWTHDTAGYDSASHDSASHDGTGHGGTWHDASGREGADHGWGHDVDTAHDLGGHHDAGDHGHDHGSEHDHDLGAGDYLADVGGHGGYDLMGADPDEEGLWSQLMVDLHGEVNPFAAR